MRYDAVLEGLENGDEYRRTAWRPLTRVNLYLSIIWITVEAQIIDSKEGDTATFTQTFKPTRADREADDWEIVPKPKGDYDDTRIFDEPDL